MSTLMFADFIELDLLDHTDASNDMFSFFLDGPADDPAGTPTSSADMREPAAVADPVAPPTLDCESTAPLSMISQNDPIAEQQSPMLLDSLKLETDSDMAASVHSAHPAALMLASDLVALNSSPLSGVTPQMISPSQLTISPESTITPACVAKNPATSRRRASTTISKNIASDLAAAAAPSKASSAKRASPEPGVAPTPRKHAKTESVSKPKSSRKSSIAVPTTLPLSPTTPTSIAIDSAAAAERSLSAAKSQLDTPPSLASLTSPESTTLSAATLQFLLQQQADTPLIPQLFTGKLSRQEIDETLNRLLESTKHLMMQSPEEEDEDAKADKSHSLASDDESDDGMDGVEGNEPATEQTHWLKTQPGIKTDDIPSSTDLKKMTSKERRQLRNKISARNFRVRRKEYIVTLEGQVLQHKTEARHLREAVTLVQEENLRLKDELEQMRRQLAETTLKSSDDLIASVGTPCISQETQPTESTVPLSKENQSLLTSIMNRNVSLNMNLPQSSIIMPNLNKDVPNSTSASTSQHSWKDKNPIMVHTTLVPEVCFTDDFQFGPKSKASKEDEMVDRPWMDSSVCLPSEMPFPETAPLSMTAVLYELMQTVAFVSYEMMAPEPESVAVNSTTVAELEFNRELETLANLLTYIL